MLAILKACSNAFSNGLQIIGGIKNFSTWASKLEAIFIIWSIASISGIKGLKANNSFKAILQAKFPQNFSHMDFIPVWEYLFQKGRKNKSNGDQ